MQTSQFKIKRILLIIFGFPLVIALLALPIWIINEYTPLNLRLYLTIIYIIVVYNLALKIINQKIIKETKDKKIASTKLNLLKILPQKIVSKTQKNPFMKQIVENTDKTLRGEKNLKEKNKRTNKFWNFLLFLISIGGAFYFSGIIDNFNQIKNIESETKITIIENRAQVIISNLNIECALNGSYPKKLSKDNLKSDFEITNFQNYEKKYLGKIIDVNDFNYENSGDSYRLCFNLIILDKCWTESCKTKL